MKRIHYALDLVSTRTKTNHMNIVFASSEAWSLDHLDLASSGHNFTKVTGSARDIRARLSEIKPDIIIFACAEPSVHAATEAELICAAAPSTPVIVFCKNPSPDFLVRVMRTGIREVLTEDAERAVLEAIARQTVRRRALNAEAITDGGVIGFIAAKGGDGATFLAANFAWELGHRTDKRVLLLDLASPFGDLDIYLAATRPPHDLADFSNEIDRLDNALIEAMVFHVNERLDLIPSASTFERFVDISPEHIVRLMEQVAQSYDFVVVDLGSRIDRLNLPVLEKLDELIIVASQEMPSIRRAGQIMELWQSMEFDHAEVSLVINRASAKSPINDPAIESAVGLAIRDKFPDMIAEVRASLLRGRPMVDIFPKSAGSKKITRWTSAYGGVEPSGTSLWHRLKRK